MAGGLSRAGVARAPPVAGDASERRAGREDGARRPVGRSAPRRDELGPHAPGVPASRRRRARLPSRRPAHRRDGPRPSQECRAPAQVAGRDGRASSGTVPRRWRRPWTLPAGSTSPSTSSVSTIRTRPAPTGVPPWPGWSGRCARGRPSVTTPGFPPRCRPGSSTSSRSSPGSATRPISSPCTTSSASRGHAGSSPRGEGRPPTPPCATCSGSPPSTRPGAISSSNVSCPRSGASRRTSTSTSSTSAARR